MKRQRIIIGFDGSVYSDKAIKYVIKNFEKGSNISLVYVEELITPVYISSPGLLTNDNMIKQIKENAIKGISKRVNFMKKNGFKADYSYRKGSPVDEIIKEAKKSKVDIIIVGSRGMGKWKGSILGSVSQGLAVRSPLPTLIVR